MRSAAFEGRHSAGDRQRNPGISATCHEETRPELTPKPAGFSLLELMVAVAVMLVVAAVAFAIFMGYQNYYQSTVLRADMHSGLRAATVLLEQEIGQAGLVSLGANCSATIPSTTTGCPTLSAVTASGTAQAVAVSSTAAMFKNEFLLVDTNSAQETVQVTALASSPASITAVFAKSHSSGAVISAVGVFPQGILSPGQTGASSSTQLNLIGDLVGDGNLYYVQYNCNPPTLTRSVTSMLTATAQSPAVTLLDDLAANPAGVPCFQYYTSSIVLPPPSGTTYYFTTAVSVTLTVQTSEIDPITKTQSTETKSFLNLVPRNILAGFNLGEYAGTTGFFQPNPSALCSTAGVTC